MKAKSQAMNAVVGKSGVTNTVDRCRQQNFGNVPGSSSQISRQQAKIMTDLDYIRSMEERYSIRDEGIF